MAPYLLLIFIPALFSFLALASKAQKQKWTLLVGTENEVRNNSFMLPVFFIILFFLIALRDETIGNDTLNYKALFNYYSKISIDDVLKAPTDVLYWLFNWLVGRFTNDHQWFFVVTAALTLIPIARLYCEDRQFGFLKIVLFVNMSTFVMLFSGLRQAMAMSMGLIAYEFVRKKKPLWFLLFALIAFGFHHTGFMVFTFYPLYHITFKKKHLWFVIPSIVLVFIFNQPIFTRAAEFLTTLFGEKYDTEVELTGAYTMLILFVLFAVLAYVLPDEKRMDRETLGLRNFLLAAVVLQCFAPVHTLAMRMNYYFVLFIPVLIPKILEQPKRKWKNAVWLIELVMIAFFLLYYLYGTYVSCRTGESALNTYPYVPFWRG